MKRSVQLLLTTVLILSVSAVTLGGTITGSRTSRTGTITGSRTGTITGSKTGTITGSRRGLTGSTSGVVQTVDERNPIGDDLFTRLLMFVLNPYF
jgi:hypothetical protein